jgi:hypothetical protein
MTNNFYDKIAKKFDGDHTSKGIKLPRQRVVLVAKKSD